MTSISNAMGSALASLRAAAAQPAAPASTTLFVAPALSGELRRELDRIAAGPIDLDGWRMCHEPVFHPDADAAADHLRSGMGPASRAAMALWLAMLADMVANAPTDPASVESACNNAWLLCQSLPAAVWSLESLIAYCDHCSFWPRPADLRQFMATRAKHIEGQIAGLDAIAKASRFREGPARGSSAYRDSRVASRVIAQEADAAIPATGPEIVKPMRSVAEQLAALGFADDAETSRAKLAEIAERRSGHARPG